MDRRLDRDWTSPVRYPDPAVEVDTADKRFHRYRIGSAGLERIWTGGRWLEGPVWFGDGRYLLFSDIPNDRLLRWTEETGEITFRQPANNANGNTRDRQGRLVTCEHRTRRVTRTENDGTITVMLDQFEGRPLNAPNCLTVHSDGAIWFTDPGYGLDHWYEGERGEMELPTRTYRLDPVTGAATVVDEALARPNGLAFSPDFSRLYIADTGASQTATTRARSMSTTSLTGRSFPNGRVFSTSAAARRAPASGSTWTATSGRDRLGRPGPGRA